jgi:hypothetical protein
MRETIFPSRSHGRPSASKCLQNQHLFVCANSCTVWHTSCSTSRKQQFQTGSTGVLLKERRFAMYLLFIPPVLAFLCIFAISLRNQFADYTNI